MNYKCPNFVECREGCLQCMGCGAISGFVNSECPVCCGNKDSVPYARLMND